jgi:microcystin degradation protein MlrC
VADWEFTMGRTAVIEADGTTIVVTSRRPPPFHGEQRTSVGVDAAEPALIVAEDHVAWTPPTAT